MPGGTREIETPTTPDFRRVVLDNGLTVLVKEVHTAPLASVWCWYHVGSKDEQPGRTGVSHWVEHMNFKGTTHIPRDQVKGIIERFGGGWNGYTWIDQTAYIETATRDALDQMLFIEAERMSSCLYDPADVESERTVIVSELQGAENDPDHVLDTAVTAAAFTLHPYRNPTIGWLPDLEALTRDDLFEHYRRYYVPANAALVVAGDVETEDVLRRVEQRFGGLEPAAAPARHRIQEPESDGERRVVVRREGTTSYLRLAYRAPAFGDPDFFPLVVLDAVLSGASGLNLWASFRDAPPSRSSRLYRALVETGLAAAVTGTVVPTAEPYRYVISLTGNPGVALSAVEAATLEALDAVRQSGVTDAELAKAKNQLRARLVLDDEGMTHIAHQLGYFETIATAESYAALPGGVRDVTRDDVHRVARTCLDERSRTVGWLIAEGA